MNRGWSFAATMGTMPSTLLVLAAVAVVLIVVVAVVVYRMTRRDPPGYYDRQSPTPGFRSNRGRGR